MATTTYDLQFPLRDLQTDYISLITQRPTFLSLVPIGQPCTEIKTEWLEDVINPTAYKISGLGSDGNGTIFTMTSTAGLKAGMILAFTTSTGASRAGTAKIASVDSATQITIVRDYAGDTLATLAINDNIIIVSAPQLEKSSKGDDLWHDQTSEWNATEINRWDYAISGTALAAGTYNNANSLQALDAYAMIKIAEAESRKVLFGQRYLPSNNSTARTAGGLFSFMKNGIVESTGGAISLNILNNAFEAIYNASGLAGGNFIILAPLNQARKISALNVAGNNPVVTRDNVGIGTYVTEFTGDLPVNNGTPYTARICADPLMPKDQIAIVDMDRVQKSYLRPTTREQLAKTTDGLDFSVINESTLRVKNGKQRFAKITGLTI